MELAARYAPNWTSIAGALEGVLAFLHAPLPTHAVMGLTGLAFALRIEERSGTWFPSPASDPLPTPYVAEAAQRLGLRLRGYDGPPSKEAALRWVVEELRQGRPVLAGGVRGPGWGIVRGIEEEGGALLVSDLLEAEVGPRVSREEFPAAAELFAPDPWEGTDALAAVRDALSDAARLLRGEAPFLREPHGAPGLVAWAELLRAGARIDRPGHAFHLARLHAARLAAAEFCADLAAAFAPAQEALHRAAAAFREEAKALSQLLTLFPYPSGGGSAASHPGLRRIAAAVLERAAELEREAAGALDVVLEAIPPSAD